MAKKDFKNNPALQFMSEPETVAAPAEAEPSPLQAAPVRRIKPGTPPPGYKVNPLYIEVRSRRVQLAIQPSIYEKLKAETERRGISVNSYIHELLEAALGEDSEEV